MHEHSTIAGLSGTKSNKASELEICQQQAHIDSVTKDHSGKRRKESFFKKIKKEER